MADDKNEQKAVNQARQQALPPQWQDDDDAAAEREGQEDLTRRKRESAQSIRDAAKALKDHKGKK
jgi:hypothetical protein